MDWAQLIASLGFPIVCVMGLAYFVWTFTNRIMTANREREEKYIEMLIKTNALLEDSQKTNALFIERLENLETDLGEIKNILTTN